MRYSLLSRFQGTLLTAAIGEALGAYCQRAQAALHDSKLDRSQRTVTLVAPVTLASWYPGLLASDPDGATPISQGGKAAVWSTHALVQSGGWQEAAMAAIGEQIATSRPTDKTPQYSQARKPAQQALNITDYAIATLPITLFFHDDEVKQQQRLAQTVNLWHGSTSAEAGALVVGYAIAQALKERLTPLTLLPQTIAYLKQTTSNPTTPLLDLMGTLTQVQALVQQGVALHPAIAQLQAETVHPVNRAIALAFYCFLSTPDDLRLALLRAARCAEAASVCAVTGALSGAYNSLNGLPLAWRLADSGLPLGWGISTAELTLLATQLLTLWSGIYHHIGCDYTVPLDLNAIAAPGVIRRQ